ncbi:MAG: oligosaccharide flippase family protein [Actinobacteria bacterium]|nr:oligosaccharide flippase family protein [Actinomycetota bacterium]
MKDLSDTPSPLKQDPRKNFLLDTLKLGSGTALAQAIAIIAVPFLSRLYLPETIGVATLFAAIVIIFSSISGFRYELSILLPENESDGFLLFALHALFTLVMGLAVGFVVWLLKAQIALLFREPKLEFYMWFVGPSIIIFGFMNGLNYWNTRRKRFKLIATTKLLNSSFMVGVQLASGFLGFATSGALVAGNVMGKFVEDFVQAWKALYDKSKEKLKIDFSAIFGLLKRYKKFPIYYTGSTLINTLSWYVPSFMLAAFFSTQVVGYYAFAERVIRMPMNTVGRAISQVFFQRGAIAHREGSLDALYRDTVQLLSLLGLVPMVILTITGREIFTIILGAKWGEAGIFAQILALYAFVWFVTSPITTLLSVIERQEVSLYFNIVNLTTRVLSLIIGGLLKQPQLGLYLFAISGIIIYGWLLLWLGKVVGVPVIRTLGDMLKPTFLAVIGVTSILVFMKIISLSDMLIVAASIFLLIVYYAFSAKKYRHFFKSSGN